MLTSSRREDAIIELFVSAYEDCTWKNSRIDWLDRVTDGAVEALITRTDGKTLAIEHTLIESFVGEREDLERFKRFLPIENDPVLRQADRIVYIDVPRGALPHPVVAGAGVIGRKSFRLRAVTVLVPQRLNQRFTASMVSSPNQLLSVCMAAAESCWVKRTAKRLFGRDR